MNKKSSVIFAAIAAAAALSALAVPVFLPASSDSTAMSNDSYLSIQSAQVEVDSDSLAAVLTMHGLVPTDGSKGAFGYGLLTSSGIDGIIVTTTHAGIKDSIVQTSADDPVWHNHFVKLKANANEACAPNTALESARLEVADLTFQSPGIVEVDGNKVEFSDVPPAIEGTSSLSENPWTITPGNDATTAVSFTLKPAFDSDGKLQHVCVENVSPVEAAKGQ